MMKVEKKEMSASSTTTHHTTLQFIAINHTINTSYQDIKTIKTCC